MPRKPKNEDGQAPAPVGDQSETPIEVKDLRKSFNGHNVLQGISVSAGHGQTVAVLGRSGTGKSVLLKLLVGLQTPDSGSIRIAGQEIGKLNPDELNQVRKRMGFLFQQAALYDSFNVAQNIAFPLVRHSKVSEADRDNKVRELLKTVGLGEEELQKMPSELSGGMQKRVGLARALALDPDILLLDEPTAGLDPITADEISNLILDLKKKRSITAMVVTHDIRSAKTFSDEIVLLKDGNITAQGTWETLKKSKDEFAAQFFRSGGG